MAKTKDVSIELELDTTEFDSKVKDMELVLLRNNVLMLHGLVHELQNTVMDLEDTISGFEDKFVKLDRQCYERSRNRLYVGPIHEDERIGG